MRKPINFPLRKGDASRQAHADFPPNGVYEREVSRNGFYGPATHFHHKHAPTGWINWEGDLRPRAFNLNKITSSCAIPWHAPLILNNPYCLYRYWKCDSPMGSLVRNGDGDELLFVHKGRCELFCDYGHISLKGGDYFLIPRSTMWRVEPAGKVEVLMIEATGNYFGLTEKGVVGNHAIFDPAVLEVPDINDRFRAQQGDANWDIYIKKHNHLSKVTYPYNPLDAVGWHGDLAPVRLNWRDIRPLMSHRYHLPPSAHTTFETDHFVVCTFVPRPFETDPGALKVPFYHNNDDYDEVIFYHQGNFFSRDNIEPGMVTFHASGFTHGPHPKAYLKSVKGTGKGTDEVAVMLDTRESLYVAEGADAIEDRAYVRSWMPNSRTEKTGEDH